MKLLDLEFESSGRFIFQGQRKVTLQPSETVGIKLRIVNSIGFQSFETDSSNIHVYSTMAEIEDIEADLPNIWVQWDKQSQFSDVTTAIKITNSDAAPKTVIVRGVKNAG